MKARDKGVLNERLKLDYHRHSALRGALLLVLFAGGGGGGGGVDETFSREVKVAEMGVQARDRKKGI